MYRCQPGWSNYPPRVLLCCLSGRAKPIQSTHLHDRLLGCKNTVVCHHLFISIFAFSPGHAVNVFLHFSALEFAAKTLSQQSSCFAPMFHFYRVLSVEHGFYSSLETKNECNPDHDCRCSPETLLSAPQHLLFFDSTPYFQRLRIYLVHLQRSPESISKS